MSQSHRKKSHNPQPSPEPAPKRAWRRSLLGLLLLVIVAGVAYIAGWPPGGLRTETQSAPTLAEATAESSPSQPTPAVEPAKDESAAVAKPDLHKLKGRWRRSGEQYVIEVRDIDENGKVDAAYFNPQPIRVGRAMAKQQKGAAALFVELSDTGYPGCTYTLVHDAKNDQLVGVYYQAAMQERYEVVFERIN